ncbi:outer membrane lipoprotein chaperone LolA [Candidatus Vallotia cooleyia]|uniref:outer membrane lipoprotein chaperone LolA n=1 Tax=Candidatus Vallotiella adelgis TaxID=1177211 RepID=UPI001D0231E1|nr:outer membrane lipoprotein chaperone LolA [Candidatus Vallotia cooleyia]UDG82096.1 Outer-membrane lipoprotein carrier protein [Candidatus Vallotia cooleyia]
MIKFLVRAVLSLVTSILIALSSMSFANASGVIQLKAFLEKVHSADGKFVQHYIKADSLRAFQAKDHAGQTPIVTASGSFQFSRPGGRFVWVYQKPYKQLLQCDGDKLYTWDEDLNQVTVRALGGELGASPASILFGSNNLRKNFSLREAGVKQSFDWLELIPKLKDTHFDRIRIGLKDGNLKEMELYDVFGNLTLLAFLDIRKNPILPDDIFKFAVPKGANVING